MSLWTRTMNAFRVGYMAFKDPEARSRDLSREQRQDIYAAGWSYYRSLQFSRRDGVDWTYYLSQRELYKHTRLIYNPVPQIVDFYVDNIWQPAQNEEFESLVTPVSDKTDKTIIEAVAQLDQWGNFLAESQKIKRYAAATGNVLVEGIDDLDRQKILHKTVWPGYVTDLELNATGDVLSYTLEYDVYDRVSKRTYRYKKIVTKDTFAYFRDDKPFTPEGKQAEVEPNPYGFCFAVWLRHTDDGGDYGLAACKNFDKVDEANSLGSHLHDNIHKEVESPVLISVDGEVLPITGATGTSASGGAIVPQDPRLNWMVFKTPAGASVHDLASKLKLAEAHPYLKELLASFSDDYPELQAASVIQKNSQLSGAALERLLTPAQNRLDGAQAGYNQQLVKLRQMQIAVAGMRVNGGGWQGITQQQALFRPFGLQSYQQGKLDFNLKPSVLIHETDDEREDLLGKKAARAKTLEGLVDQKEQLSIAGYMDEQAAEIMARTAAAAPPPAVTVTPNGLPENRQLPAGVDAATTAAGVAV
jgi:hypothetical protein